MFTQLLLGKKINFHIIYSVAKLQVVAYLASRFMLMYNTPGYKWNGQSGQWDAEDHHI